MKVGILGTGLIVNLVMEMYSKLGIEKTYIFSTERSREKAEKIVKENGLDGVFCDYDELLSSDIDTVYVALPNSLHYEFALKAIENGKNVIIEKPAASTLSQLQELIKAAKEHDVIFIEAVNLHYTPAYRELKADLDSVGRVRIVSMNYSQYSSRYDKFKQGIIAPAFDPEKSGGALMDLNVYNINALVGLFGKPVSVNYIANIERGIDTSGILSLGYPDFSAVCIGAKDCQAPVVCSVQGDKGVLVVDTPMSMMTSYRFISNDGKEQRSYKVEKPENRLYYEFVEFNRMIEAHDTVKAAEMQEISLTVSGILDEARKQVGVLKD